MFARRPVRPLDVGVPVDDKRLSVSRQQAAQLPGRTDAGDIERRIKSDLIDAVLESD